MSIEDKQPPIVDENAVDQTETEELSDADMDAVSGGGGKRF